MDHAWSVAVRHYWCFSGSKGEGATSHCQRRYNGPSPSLDVSIVMSLKTNKQIEHLYIAQNHMLQRFRSHQDVVQQKRQRGVLSVFSRISHVYNRSFSRCHVPETRRMTAMTQELNGARGASTFSSRRLLV